MSVIKKQFKAITRALKKHLIKRRGQKYLSSLAALPKINGITLIDIGAAGDIEPRWKKIEPFINYIGFEPDKRSRTQLLAKGNMCQKYEILPFAVWDKAGSVSINLCRKPKVSSHYEPNFPFLNSFRNPGRFDVLSTESLEAKALDDLEIELSDFIKIDIQGGELKALEGGQELLKKTLGLELEVEFLPLYSNQPLFGQICSFLADSGFEFIDFIDFARWGRDAKNGFGQCVFGDALFLRSPESLLDEGNVDVEIASKYLSICLLYNRFDLINKVLDLLPEDILTGFLEFEKVIKPLQRSFNRASSISRWINSVLKFTGLGEYRFHLIY